MATWIRKNSAESENLNWILANTKPCPKCKRPIEKNQGCMHMSCSQVRRRHLVSACLRTDDTPVREVIPLADVHAN